MSKRGPGPSAICLECWREVNRAAVGIAGLKTIYPVGYYDAPCLRHGKDRPGEPIRLITETDIQEKTFDPVQTDQADFPAWPDKKTKPPVE